MALRAMDLYEAYTSNNLPKDQGYVVSAFFSPQSAYATYEIVSYAEVKGFYLTTEGVSFQTNGKKIHILVEPSNYSQKAIEPYVRPSKFQIPLRFNDLNIYTTKNQYKIMYSKEPQIVMTSFTILKPTGINFAFVFYMNPDVLNALAFFFEKTLNREANVPLSDAKKISIEIAKLVRDKMGWKKGVDF